MLQVDKKDWVKKIYVEGIAHFTPANSRQNLILPKSYF